MQASARAMVAARKPGSIINLASQAGHRGEALVAHYCATKAAVISYTQSAALALAPHKIRVNSINPVAGETPLLATFMGEDTPEKRAQFISTIPLGRFSQPADIANASLFFACDESDFVTGTCMEVDGGRCV